MSHGNDLLCVTVRASRVLMECHYIRVYSYAFGIVLLSCTGDPAPAVTLSTLWPSREYREVCPLTPSKRWHESSDEMVTCEFHYLDPFIQIDYLYVLSMHKKKRGQRLYPMVIPLCVSQYELLERSWNLTTSKRWHGSADEMTTCEFYYLDPFIQIDYLYVPMIHC